LTSDRYILQTIKGHIIDFNQAPFQPYLPRQCNFNIEQCKVIEKEISDLCNRNIIATCGREPDDFISNIFLRPKKDGSHRLILNLSDLNQFIVYQHFKMESLHDAINKMTPNCWMASIDLKDAYYSVPIHHTCQKYLKFAWNGKYYKFLTFCNGLSCCPLFFTKVIKTAFSKLRAQGFESVIYIDDFYLQGDNFIDCVDNVKHTIEHLSALGFVIHPDKSVFFPTQCITFLGFILDSKSMLVKLTQEKADNIRALCNVILMNEYNTIRKVCELIGTLVSVCAGVKYGPLFYRQIENEKIHALKLNKGNFEASMVLSHSAQSDINWWIDNIHVAYKPIVKGEPHIVLQTDASNIGWGAICLTSGLKAGGQWVKKDFSHINVLELKAVLFGLKSLCVACKNIHIRVMTDNVTTVAYINQMGGSKSLQCNLVTRNIWIWAVQRNLWISCVYIPGRLKTIADKSSREFKMETEWMINKQEFVKMCEFFFKVTPSIDLFASRINKQLDKFVSWQPDPEAQFIDAFTICWSNFIFYAFPPFSIIARVLQKIKQDKAEGIIVVPNWPTAHWWPTLCKLSIGKYFYFCRGGETLVQPSQPGKIHPLHKHLQLIACHLSAIT
jgi:hypothetical protein